MKDDNRAAAVLQNQAVGKPRKEAFVTKQVDDLLKVCNCHNFSYLISEVLLTDQWFYRTIRELSDRVPKPGLPLSEYVNLNFDFDGDEPFGAPSDLDYRRGLLKIAVVCVAQLTQNGSEVSKQSTHQKRFDF